MPAPPNAPIVDVQQLRVAFGGRPVLSGLDLHVGEGSVYALLGGNGTGKSTTLSVLLGFLRPDAGQVRVAGIDPVRAPAQARRRLAYLPENVALYEHLSAFENADYLLSLAGRRAPREAIHEAFRAAGLQEAAWTQRLGGFSKGMRQKVAIAVALTREVPLLLLDEPTSGLDPGASADFHGLLASVRARGTSVLMVTHDLLGAVEVADRIGVLEQGRIAYEADRAGFDLAALHAHFSGRSRAA
ncbi:ABC transporter ATP-binding protein [Luteimonas sp. FCS-9]|uniref:ABC transporter ATP-binding protein n=1 Tax=Luteimonas sp. FCS-9 TaxID=1547516 RepID=UPI00063E76A8|nr:ABC transporter ATP-binding protein [Luteimonas sp. FCS-9]KLJ00760.1 ABC transporter ATP-binding protein [Luteimonas sp. FCS-9]